MFIQRNYAGPSSITPTSVVFFTWMGQNMMLVFGDSQKEQEELVKSVKGFDVDPDISNITVLSVVDESSWRNAYGLDKS